MTTGAPKPDQADVPTNEDLERIAALVDGKLDKLQRAEVMRLIAESEAAYEVYSETVANLRGTGHGKG